MAKGDAVFIKDVPWHRCTLTGLDKPECHCPTCQAELEAKARREPSPTNATCCTPTK